MNTKKKVIAWSILFVAGIIIILFFIFFHASQKQTIGNSVVLPTEAMTQSNTTAPQILLLSHMGSTIVGSHRLTIYQDGSGRLICLEQNHCKTKNFSSNTFNAAQIQDILGQVGDVTTVPTDSCGNAVPAILTITVNGKTSGNILCVSGEATEMYQDVKSFMNTIDSMATTQTQ